MLASDSNKIWDTGYISGSFDMFHIGHLNLIRRAKERCNRLIVGVLTDEIIAGGKKKWPIIALKERMEIIGALKYVDETDITTEELLNKINAWHKYKFDAMFSGDDHAKDGWGWEEAELNKLGAELVFFPYTKEVSSTKLREEILPPKAVESHKPQVAESFNYLFPFDKVNKNERIVIYGAGNIGRQFAKQLKALNFCVLTAFADTFAESGASFEEKPLLTPDELINLQNEFDRIVIADDKSYESILEKLRALGIEPWKVV